VLNKKNILSLFVFILVCFAAGAFGSIFTASSVGSWYQELQKPAFQPPSFVFAPVWTLLYIFMAISGWLAWNKRKQKRGKILVILFFVQLLLNALWSLLFFGLHLMGVAFAEILVLTVLVGAYIACSWRISKAASLLFVPYWLWLLFASYLNLSLWIINR